MIDVIFGFVVMTICAAATAVFMFITAAYFGAILETKEQIKNAEHKAELKDKEVLEKFLRAYEIDGKTLEEWSSIIREWETEHNENRRADTGTPDR